MAGFPEVEIGDTHRRPGRRPRPLPRLTVDEPVLRMTFGVNTSPLAGKDGQVPHRRATCASASTARCSATCRSASRRPTRPTCIEVAGRGELQLAVLIESMRREGYELQVSRPEVITKEIDGKRHEPLERGVVRRARRARRHRHPGARAPQGHGSPTCAPATPAARSSPSRRRRVGSSASARCCSPPPAARRCCTSTTPAGCRGPASCPTARAAPWSPTGSGATTGYALDNLQLRGELFVGPGETVYEGMVVGENARADDMVVNAVRAKEKTNIRTHCHDDGGQARRRPSVHTLETAIEFIADDELVEVTPDAIRIRKRLLDRAGPPPARPSKH